MTGTIVARAGQLGGTGSQRHANCRIKCSVTTGTWASADSHLTHTNGAPARPRTVQRRHSNEYRWRDECSYTIQVRSTRCTLQAVVTATNAISPSGSDAIIKRDCGGCAPSQTFTEDGTYTVPSGVTSVSVTVAGAGGGNYSPPGQGMRRAVVAPRSMGTPDGKRRGRHSRFRRVGSEVATRQQRWNGRRSWRRQWRNRHLCLQVLHLLGGCMAADTGKFLTGRRNWWSPVAGNGATWSGAEERGASPGRERH